MKIKELSYKEQKIVIFSDNSVTAFLFNEDGDVIDLACDDLEEAKSRIDKYEKIQGGFYNCDGELVKI